MKFLHVDFRFSFTKSERNGLKLKDTKLFVSKVFSKFGDETERSNFQRSIF